jgi:hypothetical protein
MDKAHLNDSECLIPSAQVKQIPNVKLIHSNDFQYGWISGALIAYVWLTRCRKKTTTS